jgi:hypothetical protein
MPALYHMFFLACKDATLQTRIFTLLFIKFILVRFSTKTRRSFKLQYSVYYFREYTFEIVCNVI